MKFKIKFADQIVGALSIIAIAALIFFTFFIASTQKWFVKKHNFFTKITSASSVNEGMALQYKGFGIGKIKKITLGDDDSVIVHFYVLDEYIDRVTQGSIVELSVSPIGLGSSFILYQGDSNRIIVDDSFIPEKSSAAAKELIKENKVLIPEQNDTLTNIIGSATNLINHIDELIQQINQLLQGNESLPLAKTVNNINRILRQVSALLSSDDSFQSFLKQKKVKEPLISFMLLLIILFRILTESQVLLTAKCLRYQSYLHRYRHCSNRFRMLWSA